MSAPAARCPQCPLAGLAALCSAQSAGRLCRALPPRESPRFGRLAHQLGCTHAPALPGPARWRFQKIKIRPAPAPAAEEAGMEGAGAEGEPAAQPEGAAALA